ncbi:MAG: amidohydrolase, partial [Candidatus Bathyarchaeia archaeon]
KEIWKIPELGLEEYHSSKLIIDFLDAKGFTIEKGVAGIPTAFIATYNYGDRKPVIGINCEYDALPGLSQESITKKQPIVPGAPGHGCGHNLLGVGSAGAAASLKIVMEKYGLSGIVKVLGAPAEEICVGKPFMARAGLFEKFDAIIDWHPYFLNQVLYDTCNAYFNIKFHFKGRTAHGNAPWEGCSALDSAILMGHAIELLREHIIPGEATAANTINYTFSDVGPEYPNVVPDRSTLWCVGRIQNIEQMEPILMRLKNCAEGASIATGTQVNNELITITHEKIPNSILAEVLYKNLVELGLPTYSLEEEEFAKELQRSCQALEIGMDKVIQPLGPGATAVSDNSEYSWFAPFAMAWIACVPPGVGWHNWQVNAAVNSGIGWKGMLLAARVLMTSGVDLLTNESLIQEAKEELKKRLNGRKYKSLLPFDTPVPLEINRQIMEKYRPLMEEKIRSQGNNK